MWVLLTAIAAVWVVRYSRRFPYSNDWDVVPVLVGRKPFTLGWLWSQSTDHRLFVPRLVISALAGITNGDFRSVAWFDFVLLSGSAAVAIRTMRRVRGVTAFSDMLFPLVLLSPFQFGLTWSFAVHFTTVGVASLGVLLLMVRFGLDAPPRWLWVVVVLALVLVGDGAPGLALVPGILAWLVLSALRLRRTARVHSTGVLVAVGAFVVIGGLYFVGWRRVDLAPPASRAIMSSGLRLASAIAGPGAYGLWPFTGVLIGLALVATVGLLGWRWWSSPPDTLDRCRATALACFGVSVAAMLIAFGFGRGSVIWEADMANQYSGLVIPIVCWLYLSWVTMGNQAGGVAGAVLFVVVIGAYANNVGHMQDTFAKQERQERAFVRDLCRLDVAALASRHRHFLLLSPSDREVREVAVHIRELRRDDMAGFGCS